MTENLDKQDAPEAVAKDHGYQQHRVPSELMTEDDLIQYLRIPEVSKAKDYHNAIANLTRMHDLPRIHICGQPLYPREAIQEWIRTNTTNGKK